MPGMIVLDCLHFMLIDLKRIELDKKIKLDSTHLMILTRDCLHLRQTVLTCPAPAPA